MQHRGKSRKMQLVGRGKRGRPKLQRVNDVSNYGTLFGYELNRYHMTLGWLEKFLCGQDLPMICTTRVDDDDDNFGL